MDKLLVNLRLTLRNRGSASWQLRHAARGCYVWSQLASANGGCTKRMVPVLVDRVAEADTVDRVLAAARDGLSGVLVLRGEAGIGKTALLDHVVENANDMQVAQVTGVESEMDLGFAGLHCCWSRSWVMG